MGHINARGRESFATGEWAEEGSRPPVVKRSLTGRQGVEAVLSQSSPAFVPVVEFRGSAGVRVAVEDVSGIGWHGEKPIKGRKRRRGPRGVITGYSAGARRRLFSDIARLPDRLGPPLLATLTMPGGWGLREAWRASGVPAGYMSFAGDWGEVEAGERAVLVQVLGPDCDPRRHRAMFRAFKERLRREFPGAFGLWRAEWQRRVAMHWHVALWGVERVPRDWLSQSWYETCGSGEVSHLRAGTQIAAARAWNGLGAYLGKELGKGHQAAARAVAELYGSSGRTWGRIAQDRLRAEFLPVERVYVELDQVGPILEAISTDDQGHTWTVDQGAADRVRAVLAGAASPALRSLVA